MDVVRKETLEAFFDGVPRRFRLEKMCPAERAITDVIHLIEEYPPHPLLTDAIRLLQRGRDKVADYVDGPMNQARAYFEKNTKYVGNAPKTKELEVWLL